MTAPSFGYDFRPSMMVSGWGTPLDERVGGYFINEVGIWGGDTLEGVLKALGCFTRVV
jgi:hypothetical protein